MLNKQTLAKNIKKQIKKSGYKSLEKFCLENGIAKSTLSEIMSGKNYPRLSTLDRIADALEIEVYQLLKP